MSDNPQLADVCPTEGCGAAWAHHTGTMSTLVGYMSPPGHSHDDNCQKRDYICTAGHHHILSARRRRPTSGCEWVGKSSCFDTGEKLDRWPNAVPEIREPWPSHGGGKR